MKQSKIMSAYCATNILANSHELSKDQHWDIFCLRRNLKPHVEFYNEQSEAIDQKYLKLADENGKVFGKDAIAYRRELEELDNMEKDLGEIRKIRIPMIDGINSAEMEAVEDFIEFYRDEPAENAPGVC